MSFEPCRAVGQSRLIATNHVVLFMVKKVGLLCNIEETFTIKGSGCGAVGRAVVYDTRDLWFESSHRQIRFTMKLY